MLRIAVWWALPVVPAADADDRAYTGPSAVSVSTEVHPPTIPPPRAGRPGSLQAATSSPRVGRPRSLEPATSSPRAGAVIATPEGTPESGGARSFLATDAGRLMLAPHGRPVEEDARLGHGAWVFFPGLQLRTRVGWRSEGVPARGSLGGRVRWQPRLVWNERISIHASVDLVPGTWFPPTDRPPIVDPRELFLEIRRPRMFFRVGQQGVTWGQGMLLNDGDTVDRFGDLRFGDDSRGTLVERVMIGATSQGRPRVPGWTIAFALDLVVRDRHANLRAGDLAPRAVMTAELAGKTSGVGVWVSYREQWNPDDPDPFVGDGRLSQLLIDATGHGMIDLRGPVDLVGAFEAAFVTGQTTFFREARASHRLRQGGIVVRGYAGVDRKWWVGFDGGWASGDTDPRDGRWGRMTFDPGATAGLILFAQVLAEETAAAVEQASDGTLGQVPPNGIEHDRTHGGVANAVYVHPKGRVAVGDWFELWGGPLWAWRAAPTYDPVASDAAGGVPAQRGGGDGARRFYGTELDVGLRARFELRRFWFQTGVQGGVWLSGGPAVGVFAFRTELRY